MPPNGSSRAQKFSIIAAALLFLLVPYTYWLFHSTHPTSSPLPSPQSLPSLEASLSSPPPNDVLILYVYHETEFARPNGEFFIRHGLHSAADFIFILNGKTDIDELLPKNAPNIRVWRRENECYDLGAYGAVLSANNNELVGKYKKFILMNSSIRGPFVPHWSRECWSDAYLSKLTDRVKLVGMTYNCHPTRHIQSMLLATDLTGLSLLLTPLTLLTCHTYASAMNAEIRSTSLITDAGYDIDVMMSAFHKDRAYARSCTHGDVLFEGAYWGGNVHPYELLFFKTNRGVSEGVLERLSEWVGGSGYKSWDVCER